MAYSKKEREEYNKHRERTSGELGLNKTDPRGAALYAAKKRIHPDRYSTEGHVIY